MLEAATWLPWPRWTTGPSSTRGAEIRARADHYARLQKRLQRKGTRSATRRRIALGQRERRLKLNTNHAISKRILVTHPRAFIGLEELTGIRERTKRRTRRRKGKQLFPVSKKARRANRHASKWAFAELQGLLTYKASLAGSLCIKLDADYTSQACPRCGFKSRANRPQHGLLFVCVSSVTIRCMRIWWGLGILRYERWSFGMTGWPRGSCQMPPM